MEISFFFVEGKGYCYNVENNVDVYSIKFKSYGANIKVYSKPNVDSLEDLHFISDIKLPKDEKAITFKLDIPENINLVLITPHEIEYAKTEA